MKTRILLATAILLLAASMQAATPQKSSSSKFMPKSSSEIFLGRVLEASSVNKSQYEFGSTPFKNITVSFSIPVKSVSIAPTQEAMMAAAKEAVKSQKIPQSQDFSFSKRELASYDDLKSLFGQEMSISSLLGKKDLKKTHKTLVAFDLNRVFFTMVMDFPESAVSGATSSQIYINSVGFGRRALVVIESDMSAADIKAAADEAISSTGVLSDKTSAILANSNIHIVNFGNGSALKANADNPFSGLKEYIAKAPTESDFGKIITFSASYVKDNSVFVNEY